MAKKKKRNKQPAKKRDRGTILSISEKIQDLKEQKEECKEIFLKQLNNKHNDYENNIENFLKDSAEKFELNTKYKKVKTMYGRLFMPRDTKENFPQKIENLNLKIHKFPYFELKNKNEFKTVYYDKYCTDFDSSFYYINIEKLKLQKKSFESNIADKLIIGLGGASVYETSITLHHIYGVPYVPASAIKGSFRSYIIYKYFENDEQTALQENWFVDIFGDQKEQGKVYFFDAFAIDSSLKIEKDIMNPHYPDYYTKENKYPTDDQNPTPINFLSIKGKFKFIFGVKEKDTNKIIGTKKTKILEFIEEELQNSLKEFGIGAKTSIGYGYFS